ncbi:MAG: riboflavin kinase, partial [Gammaproteobacteria bacterium]
NFSTLESLGNDFGFDVHATESLCLDGERVSSTIIRRALEEGDFNRASRLLGRQYGISGRIVHGENRGKRLGFPTANIELHRMLTPVSGIFAAKVKGIEEQSLDSAVYIGTRPVFNGKHTVLEVHILDFDSDIYGKHMRVELLKKIRGDEMFDSEAELQQQIADDVRAVRAYFSANQNINKRQEK